MNTTPTDPETYEAPAIHVAGLLRDVTQGNVAGTHTDKQFPADTPIQNLTFS